MDEHICEECGDDLVCEGLRYCTECLGFGNLSNSQQANAVRLSGPTRDVQHF